MDCSTEKVERVKVLKSENLEVATWKYGGAELGGRFSCFTFKSGDLNEIGAA